MWLDILIFINSLLVPKNKTITNIYEVNQIKKSTNQQAMYVFRFYKLILKYAKRFICTINTSVLFKKGQMDKGTQFPLNI